MERKHFLTAVGALALLLVALPAAAVDPVIYSGIDIWYTPANGSTFFDFSQDPLPAGFFCAKSKPFAGRVYFRGVPIATADGSLGRTDTIVQRLDDAVFDDNGVATTRVQLRALQFQSIRPLKTACGSFNAHVRLDGEQPITEMKIIRESENGGRFLAAIAVRARVSFTPVRGKARQRLEVTRAVNFQPNPFAVWSSETGNLLQKSGFVLVDTDADGQPDTSLPGTSNFAAGISMDKTCHYDPGCGGHCQYPTISEQ